MARPKETQLYFPVKAFLEAAGYCVKAEIGPADVVGIAGESVVIVELKTHFSLTLLQQAVARQRVTDLVYVAVPRWQGRAGWRAFKGNLGLCRRLGLGVLTVSPDARVDVHADPGPYRPRKSARHAAAMLGEFARRRGDPNKGGMAGRRVTSYRQAAERCAKFLVAYGASKGAVVAKGAQAVNATRIMADNHYGWFRRVSTGIYELSPEGRAAWMARDVPGEDFP